MVATTPDRSLRVFLQNYRMAMPSIATNLVAADDGVVMVFLELLGKSSQTAWRVLLHALNNDGDLSADKSA